MLKLGKTIVKLRIPILILSFLYLHKMIKILL